MTTVDRVVAALMQPIPLVLATEKDAVCFFIEHRWPEGPRCQMCNGACSIDGAHLICLNRECEHRMTVFVDTHLECLRKPRVRPLLYALRAMLLDQRGVSARPLARRFGVPETTMWRHLHRLRLLLPSAAWPTIDVARVPVCGRRGNAYPAAVLAGADPTPTVGAVSGGPDPTKPGRRRMVCESMRTWLNGTFRGVTAGWLPLYMLEANARMRRAPAACMGHVLQHLLRPMRSFVTAATNAAR